MISGTPIGTTPTSPSGLRSASGELHPLGERDEERQDAEGIYG
jgi:hypothetical protein